MTLLTNLWVRLVVLLVVVAASIFGFLSIRKAYAERAQFKQEYLEQKASAEDYQRRTLEANNLAEKRAKSSVQIHTVTKEVLREVPIRIPPTACPLAPDWRVLHDAAAEGSAPAPTGGADAAGTAPGEAPR